MINVVDIWCIVRENRSVFQITIGKDKNVFELKVAIKNLKSNYYARADPDDLILWRVDVASSILKNKDASIESYLTDKLEEEVDTIGDTISNVEGSNIRIIVEIDNHIPTIRDLRYELFIVKTDNARKPTSVFKYVRKYGDVQVWQIEHEIDIELLGMVSIGNQVFSQYPNAPTQGLNEITVNQPFCKNVVKEIVDRLYLQNELLVLGNCRTREGGQDYPDIIIGLADYHQELTSSPPDLSKCLGWEVKSSLRIGANVNGGKGQLVKYARAYLTANPPLSHIFYGCLTDGRLWKFVRIQLIDDDGAPKVKFEQSQDYEWSAHTASLIACIINHYYYSVQASDKEKVSPNNDETNNKVYMYRGTKPLISSESLLASFIKEGVHIKLNSGNYIHVQIISHLGTGKECIVFLAQVRDYGIKEAVLKIEVRKDTEISQVYQEISALHALSDLSCVPKILFEGHTAEGSLALLTNFVGQPLESWIFDKGGNLDDYTLFQIILDLLLCLEKIHCVYDYIHGDVAIRNVIHRNGRFYLIDFGLATMLQLHRYPCQAIIRDYIGLCQIIGIIKFEKEMLLLELIDKLDGELKQFVATIESAIRQKITNEEEWLENFGAKIRQLYERGITCLL